MQGQDDSARLQAQVAAACAANTPLHIVGGNSKAFYGGTMPNAIPLSTCNHHGIVAYEPSELVLTVRSGTPLQVVENLLANQGQILGFEPPHFAATATIGGAVACGLSGPRRPFAGSVRDFVLGCQLINGQAEILRFGGQVIKNVAGFDVSRLMAGAMGQLGVLLQISLKVLPMPEAELTHHQAVADPMAAIARMQQWQGQPWPLSGLCYVDGQIYYRLSGATTAIQGAAQALGGDRLADGIDFWQALREQQLPFFQDDRPLWRISLPPATAPLPLPGDWLLDWGGSQRWLKTSTAAASIHTIAKAHNGYAVCYRSTDKSAWLQLEPGLLALQQNIRQAFDPQRLFNRNRLLPD
jgi:glycolate oxidase FAD binding subunit